MGSGTLDSVMSRSSCKWHTAAARHLPCHFRLLRAFNGPRSTWSTPLRADQQKPLSSRWFEVSPSSLEAHRSITLQTLINFFECRSSQTRRTCKIRPYISFLPLMSPLPSHHPPPPPSTPRAPRISPSAHAPSTSGLSTSPRNRSSCSTSSARSVGPGYRRYWAYSGRRQ